MAPKSLRSVWGLDVQGLGFSKALLRGCWSVSLRKLFEKGAESLQNPLIKEYTLNLIRVLIIV